ncbi:MAG TPA: queuosine precursor transporter [Arsenophonus sp.]
MIIPPSNHLVQLPITIFGFHTTWRAFTFPRRFSIKVNGQGFITLNEFNLFVARIALASFMAYVVGQIMGIFVFNKLRKYSGWWIAPAAAMFFGNLLDTIAFFFIAFYRSTDPFMATDWVETALVDYSFNLLICMLFFLPAYGLMLNVILRFFLINQPVKNCYLATR